MQAHEIVKALLVRRDGVSVKAARLIEEQALEIESNREFIESVKSGKPANWNV